jgi:hypothetical protein
VGPGAGLADVEKRNFLILPGLELRHLGRPARRQSLYRLRPVNKTTDLFMVYLTTLRVAVVAYFVTCMEELRNVVRILNQGSQSPGPKIEPRTFQ